VKSNDCLAAGDNGEGVASKRIRVSWNPRARRSLYVRTPSGPQQLLLCFSAIDRLLVQIVFLMAMDPAVLEQLVLKATNGTGLKVVHRSPYSLRIDAIRNLLSSPETGLHRAVSEATSQYVLSAL
jgi:hypothetical protein